MKFAKYIVLLILIAFVGIQFMPTTRNQSNSTSKNDFMLHNNVPIDIKNMLQVSCYDCHSNHTKYPWYNKVQPIAWFLEGHVTDGKTELNFSEWNSLSIRRKKSKLQSIINQIEADEMPLSTYTLIHKEAKFSKDDKARIMQWMEQLRDGL